MTICGHPAEVGPWETRIDNSVRRRTRKAEVSPSICTASAVPQQRSGQPGIQQTCEVSKDSTRSFTFSTTEKYYIMSQSRIAGRFSRWRCSQRETTDSSLIAIFEFGEHQTTNLGVRSSNLFGRAASIDT